MRNANNITAEEREQLQRTTPTAMEKGNKIVMEEREVLQKQQGQPTRVLQHERFLGGAVVSALTSTMIICFFLVGFSGPESGNALYGSAEGGTQVENGAEDPHYEKPLIIDIAQGTTGTRTMTKVFCKHFGVPSMHGSDDNCKGLGPEGKEVVKDWYNEHYHNAKIPVNEGAKPCTYTHMRKNGGYCNATHAWLESNFRAIDMILASRHIDGLLDSPFPFYASYIIPAAKRIRNGLDPFVIVTERNATEWTTKRLEKQNKSPICQPFPTSEMFYLDFVECYQEAVRYKENMNNNKTDVHEETKIRIWALRYLVMSELSGYTEEEARAKIADAFARQQVNLVQMANYSFNLFTQDPIWTETDIAHKITEALPQICELWHCKKV